MQMTVTGRHMDITDPIRQYAEQKTEKLPRYYDRIRRIEIIVDKHDAHEHKVELIAHVDGHNPFIASVHSADLYACIDEVTTKIERQLHDHKEKMRNHKHSAHST